MGASWEVRQGDCVEEMRKLDDCSVDAVVTDPPYGINFMGKAWDGAAIAQAVSADEPGDHTKSRGRSASMHAGEYDLRPTANRAFQQWCEAWAIEALRVLKPGGHLLAFGGTRTYHRLAAGIEDAGFEIRDCLAWLFGSGFPKSLDVPKAIDKAADYRLQAEVRRAAVAAVEAAGLELPGNSKWDWTVGEHAPGNAWWAEFQRWLPGLSDEDRERVEGEIVARVQKTAGWFTSRDVYDVAAPATAEAERWRGWGTALKPAHEPIVVARKPLAGTVAANVLEHGTGALNIDGCRIDAGGDKLGGGAEKDVQADKPEGWDRPWRNDPDAQAAHAARVRDNVARAEALGRWPANVVLDPEAAALLNEQTGELQSGSAAAGGHRRNADKFRSTYGQFAGETVEPNALYGDRGGASRFFYCAKASRAERNAGLEHLPALKSADEGYGSIQRPKLDRAAPRENWEPHKTANHHPTVKPIDLMRWLVRLVTPPGGLVLDPFVGSGTTGCAAVLEGFDFLGLERESEYVEIATARIGYWADPEKARIALAEAERERQRVEAEESGAEVQLDLETLLTEEAA